MRTNALARGAQRKGWAFRLSVWGAFNDRSDASGAPSDLAAVPPSDETFNRHTQEKDGIVTEHFPQVHQRFDTTMCPRGAPKLFSLLKRKPPFPDTQRPESHLTMATCVARNGHCTVAHAAGTTQLFDSRRRMDSPQS